MVQGGGRFNGNTSQLADAFIQGAMEAGHTVEKISLNKTEVKGCIGCNACRYGKPCVQKDGFNELVPKIKTADLIVFASPLLFWTLSSKIKAFIERFYCIAEEDPNPPLGRYERYPVKDAALLMTSADDFSGHMNRRYPITNLRLSIILVSMIKGCCLPEGAEIRMENRRLIKRTTLGKPTISGKIFTENRVNRKLFLAFMIAKAYLINLNREKGKE